MLGTILKQVVLSFIATEEYTSTNIFHPFDIHKGSKGWHSSPTASSCPNPPVSLVGNIYQASKHFSHVVYISRASCEFKASLRTSLRFPNLLIDLQDAEAILLVIIQMLNSRLHTVTKCPCLRQYGCRRVSGQKKIIRICPQHNFLSNQFFGARRQHAYCLSLGYIDPQPRLSTIHALQITSGARFLPS